MAVTIIVPMYNAQGYLEKCLEGIAAQTFKDAQVILVDDRSQDRTLAIAEPLARRHGFTLLKRERNGGAAAARNEGAHHATGDIMIFLDVDIFLKPTAVADIVSLMSAPGVDAVSTLYTQDLPDANFSSHFQNLTSIYRHSKLDVASPVFFSFFCALRKDVFEAIKGYDETLPSYEDIELGHRLRQAGFHCKLTSQVQVLHIKRYTHAGLLREYFHKAAAAAAYTVAGIGSGRPKGDNCPRHLKQAGLCLIFALACAALLQWVPALVFLGLYSLLVSPMLGYLSANKGLWFGLRSYLLCLEVYLVSIAALAYGVINHKQCLSC